MKRGEQDAKLSSSVVVEKRKMQSEYDTCRPGQHESSPTEDTKRRKTEAKLSPERPLTYVFLVIHDRPPQINQKGEYSRTDTDVVGVFTSHKKARVVLGQIHILDDEESEEESDERRDELNWVD